MKVNLRQIYDRSWAQGWVLDKHTTKSTLVGHDANGRPQFETLRTEAGEATYQLKYRRDLSQATRLAEAIATHVYPKFEHVGFIVPMPASTPRPRQPVTEVAAALGRLVNRPVSDQILQKRGRGQSMKDLQAKQDKVAALGGAFTINEGFIQKTGRWNVLLVDDLYASGATMEAAAATLKAYSKVRNVYVVALTWS